MSETLNFSANTAEFDFIDFDDFHQNRIQPLIDRRIDLVRDDLAHSPSLTLKSITTTATAYTYHFDDQGLSVTAGELGDVVVAISPESFSDFYHELLTISGMAAKQDLTMIKGDISEFRRWEPALRALYTGRPIYTGDVLACLTDSTGAALALDQQFSVHDLRENREQLLQFFTTMGYLHIKQVFSGEEIAQMQSQISNAIEHSRADDGKSWWSTLENGAEVPTRINYLNRFSSFFDTLGHDSRIQDIGTLLDPALRVCLDRVDGPMVFIKSSHVKTGLANLLWHKDCDLGGHPIMCPIIQLGIQLDCASASNGQVCMLAGSHKYSNHILEIGDEANLPVVPLITEPGDVTLHYGHTLHCTPAPTSDNAARKVLYYKFEKPEMFDHIPAGAHYNDILFNTDEGGRVATRAKTWKSDKQLDGD